jgi:hypothetical protein
MGRAERLLNCFIVERSYETKSFFLFHIETVACAVNCMCGEIRCGGDAVRDGARRGCVVSA